MSKKKRRTYSRKVERSGRKQIKQIEIANQRLTSVIDTGSHLNLINYDFYDKIGCPKLSDKINFDGLDAKNNKTYGSFATKVIIDGDEFNIVLHVVDILIVKYAILIGADF